MEVSWGSDETIKNMVTEIRWSDNAIQDYNLIVEYLLEEWNEDVALQFIEIIEYKVQQVA